MNKSNLQTETANRITAFSEEATARASDILAEQTARSDAIALEVVDRKFRGTNFIYTLKTTSNKLIPVFVHSHHIHQHEVDEKFGIKRPINIDHIVCF